MDETPSRRRALQACGGALVAALAGCVGGSGGGGEEPTDTVSDTVTDSPTTTRATQTTERTETITVERTTEQLMEPIESAELPETGASRYIEQVESFPDRGAKHVAAGSDIDYEQVPPTSGPHYSSVVRPGFYNETRPLESLVHNLEHGGVVIYYDPTAITDEARESLKAFAQAHTDTWAHVVVVPSPHKAPRAPYVLTAWRHRLDLESYDAEAVRAFLAEYVGRGPENPVR